jgi:hypothetical protein
VGEELENQYIRKRKRGQRKEDTGKGESGDRKTEMQEKLKYFLRSSICTPTSGWDNCLYSQQAYRGPY